jgi:hypothetical protein
MKSVILAHDGVNAAVVLAEADLASRGHAASGNDKV